MRRALRNVVLAGLMFGVTAMPTTSAEADAFITLCPEGSRYIVIVVLDRDIAVFCY
jgi:Pyruvate/2-oxoacid:ferredoxin oxidoreductase gamma subunit